MITIEQICSLNLGKEIDYYRDYKVMVVGYNKRFNFIICSCTKNDGWTEMIDSDTILIQSPLNVSFSILHRNMNIIECNYNYHEKQCRRNI